MELSNMGKAGVRTTIVCPGAIETALFKGRTQPRCSLHTYSHPVIACFYRPGGVIDMCIALATAHELSIIDAGDVTWCVCFRVQGAVSACHDPRVRRPIGATVSHSPLPVPLAS